MRIGAAVLLCVACSNRASAPAEQPAAASDDASHDASSGASASPDAAAAAPEIELLHLAGAKVAVSSTVDNDKLPPLALVDGDLATAWNSRTGQLEGAWIDVRVPWRARVARIAMTAGFTGRGPEGDYFVMNPRIREVRVTHRRMSGSPRREVVEEIGRFRLDPESRDLQSLPVHGSDGEYRIEVTATVPGTRKSWREVCVSELQVWGQLPADLVRNQIVPDVVVGSLDAVPPVDVEALAPLPAGPFLSSEQFCKRWLAPRDRAEAARQRRCATRPAPVDQNGPVSTDDECNYVNCGPTPHCEAAALSEHPLRDAFRAAEVVTLGDSACSSPTCYLAITDARGMWLVHAVAMCGTAEGIVAGLDTLALRVVDHKLVWQYAHHIRMDGETNEQVTVECVPGLSGPECTASTE